MFRMGTKIIDAKWHPKVNYLLIECGCGNRFWHRADRRKITCHKCLTMADCMKLKDKGMPINGTEAPDKGTE